jgi:hypothetical protein
MNTGGDNGGNANAASLFERRSIPQDVTPEVRHYPPRGTDDFIAPASP